MFCAFVFSHLNLENRANNSTERRIDYLSIDFGV